MIGIKLSKQLTLAKIHIFLSNAFSWQFITIFRAILEEFEFRENFQKFLEILPSRMHTDSKEFEPFRNESHRLPITVLPFISACLSLSVPRRSKVENVNVANNSNLGVGGLEFDNILCARSSLQRIQTRRGGSLSFSLSPKELVYGVVAIHYHRHEPEWLGSLSRRMY